MELQNAAQRTLQTGDMVDLKAVEVTEVDRLLKQLAGLYLEQSQAIAGGRRESVLYIAQKISDLKTRLNAL